MSTSINCIYYLFIGTVAKNENITVAFHDKFKGIVLSTTPLPIGVNTSDTCYYLKNNFFFITADFIVTYLQKNKTHGFFENKNEWTFLISKFLNCTKP